MVKKTHLCAAAMAALLGACASPPLPPGASREAVTARYGTPSGVVPLNPGTRLLYSRQPTGQSVVAVDLDAAGRVVDAREMMRPEGFSHIVVGQWTRQDIERAFGPPAAIDQVTSWTGDIMTYRWRDDTGFDMHFWVYLDPGNVVRRTGQGMEIKNRGRDD